MKSTLKLNTPAPMQDSHWNTTGFGDSTVTAVCAIMGISRAASCAEHLTGLMNTLREIHAEDFAERQSFTIGEVVAAYANHLIEIC